MKQLFSKSILTLCLALSVLLSGCVSESIADTPITNIQSSSQYDTSISDTSKLESEQEALPENSTEKPSANDSTEQQEQQQVDITTVFSIEDIPEYSGSPYIEVNDNIPFFTDNEVTDVSFESYSNLDNLGRCGVATASIGIDIMPTEDRGSIGQVKPTGWETIRYDIVDGDYLYNRCHLIGFQLSGENANEQNLITGTRSMNVDAMLPFENLIADYVKETQNHVYYRVTPIFEGDNLLASGVLLEGKSVEDNGEGVLFNVYCYNTQDGITIDYLTGNSNLTVEDMAILQPPTTQPEETTPSTEQQKIRYILNTDSRKIHLPNCRYVDQMNEENKEETGNSVDDLLNRGYEPCKVCNP